MARLGVSRQTLYAYVSRSRIGMITAPDDTRRSLYDATDVNRLAERNRSGRTRRAIAASTISWGEPILVSTITRIGAGRLTYREWDAVALSATATLEETAALLWQAQSLPQLDSRDIGSPAPIRAGIAESCLAAMADLAMVGPWAERLEGVLPDAVRILDRMAWAVSGPVSPVPSLRLPVHERLALAWGVGRDAAHLIRQALVLTADHELNASTYAARVVASTRAPLGACVLAGLAALVGPLHGGMTNELRRLLADPRTAADPLDTIAATLARGEVVPGFGHPLYPDGDPRAAALLSRLRLPLRAQRLIEAMHALTGVPPNVDCALVVLEKKLRLPPGAAFAIFAVGRTVGWIAHALEQWRSGTLIRPRAVSPGAGDISPANHLRGRVRAAVPGTCDQHDVLRQRRRRPANGRRQIQCPAGPGSDNEAP
jgi:citrate synthase